MSRMVGLVALAGLLACVSSSEVTPVQKVLQMMNDMKAKGLKEKDGEIVAFKTTMQFCKDTIANKEKAVADAKDLIAKLSADIEQYNSDAKVLGKEIEKLDASADEATNEAAASTTEFEEQKTDYENTHAEYETNIADIEVGTSQLKSMMSATNAASLIQKMTSNSRLPKRAHRVLEAFLATSSAIELESAAPEGSKFDSQSGGIVEMMEGLTSKMEDEKTTLEQEFVKTRGSYQMMQQTLTGQIDQHKTMRNMKAGTKKDKESSASAAEGEKASTKTSKASDEQFLKDLYVECATKSSEYESNQKIRAGEVTALNKAIEIIAGGAVSGASEKHLPQLVQTSVAAASFAQLRNAAAKQQSQSAAASFLQAQGRRLSSRVLSTLSQRVAEDPFAKVKKMIQDMVYKLMEEANEEAEHKGFCDTELGTNKMTREQKTTTVNELTASIEEMTAKISTLSDEIGDLSGQIGDIDAAVAEATAIRADEKAKNAVTVTDAIGASTAVKQALGVLQAYYEGLSLVQRGSSHGPAQSSASTGVIGMLEVILSDFERLEADTKASEETNQKEFGKFSDDSSQDKAVKEQHVKNKSETRTETDVANAQAKKDLKSTQEELDAAEAYFEKLKPSCVESGNSYEDRVARRKEEIESLKEALKILDDQDI